MPMHMLAQKSFPYGLYASLLTMYANHDTLPDKTFNAQFYILMHPVLAKMYLKKLKSSNPCNTYAYMEEYLYKVSTTLNK